MKQSQPHTALQMPSRVASCSLFHRVTQIIGHCEGEVKGYLNSANLHKRCGNPTPVHSHKFTIIIIYLQYFIR